MTSTITSQLKTNDEGAPNKRIQARVRHSSPVGKVARLFRPTIPRGNRESANLQTMSATGRNYEETV